MPTVTVIQPTITEEQNIKIRCAAYCRVSSDSNDQLNSFMAQTRYYSQVFENSETEELIDICRRGYHRNPRGQARRVSAYAKGLPQR